MSDAAPEQTTQILITPEMIDAGLTELGCQCGAQYHRDEVAAIYRAMEYARRRVLSGAAHNDWVLTPHGYEGPLDLRECADAKR